MDIGNKFLLAVISQVLQHPFINKIKRKSLFQIPAHHASGQGIVKQFLTLADDVLHNQSTWIVLIPPLAASGFRKPQRAKTPEPFDPDQGKKSPQPPAVLRIDERYPNRQVAYMVIEFLLLIECEIDRKRLRDFPDVMFQIFTHFLQSVGELILSRTHKADLIR